MNSIYYELDIFEGNRTHLLLHAYDVHDMRLDEDVHAFLVGTQYEDVYKIDMFLLLPDGRLKYDDSIGWSDEEHRNLFFNEHVPAVRTEFEKYVITQGGKVVEVISDTGDGASYNDVLAAHTNTCRKNSIVFCWIGRHRF